jgi:arginine exporter protein ArgO
MIVRIRLGSGKRVQQKRRKNQHIALAMASLLTPAAVMACVLALWRLAADLGDTAQFPITNGLFSHWQVWFATAAIVQFSAIVLNRYGTAETVLPDAVNTAESKLASSRY